MRLSVLIPYYNRNDLIGRALDSLLDQDLESSDYEIIVVDDGSQEEPVVLKEYASRWQQVKYHKIEHAGLSPVMKLREMVGGHSTFNTAAVAYLRRKELSVMASNLLFCRICQTMS